MKDCNGRNIQVGDKVRHALAKHVTDWGNPRVDMPRADRPLMSLPFPATAAVQGFAGSLVKVTPSASKIPNFLPCFLEIVD